MSSLILAFSGRILLPLSIAFSLWLLWRGHNEPGGGFVAGLVAALDVSVGKALDLGLVPFLGGDAVKIALACGVLPSAWALRGRLTR